MAHSEEAPGSVGGEPEVRYDEVVVTGSPVPRTLFELASPTSVLQGPELDLKQQGSVGETLQSQPGVNATGFSPGASRPVIRGLDGDRIRVLQNGVGVGDASQTSVDHAVSADPITIDRLEVVRGPATLLYGPSAIGGVVNAIDNRIPDARIPEALRGRIVSRASSADFGRSLAGAFEGGVGGFAYHLSGFKRKSEDLGVSGFARSYRLRAIEAPDGEEARDFVPNSAAEAWGGAVGLSYVGDRGYVGFAPSSYESAYGVIAEPDVTIRLLQRRLDLAGALLQPLPGIAKIKSRLALTDYEHTEFEGAEVGTVFENDGLDARLEVLHDPLGPLEGAFGFQSQRSDFSALGAEAYLPPSLTQIHSGFLFEEVGFGAVRAQLGVRLDYQHIATDTTTAFGASRSRSFLTPSGSVGLVYRPHEHWALTASVGYTQRAPNTQELFANGPHIATNAFEVGDRRLSPERALGIDVGVRKNAGRVTGSVTAYYNRFSNFIALLPTGVRDPDEDLPIFGYANVPAHFAGFEAEGAYHLFEHGIHHLDVTGQVDYVWAENRSTGEPLPRISPLRFGGGLAYHGGPLGLRLDILRVQSQRRHTRQELSTDGYNMLDATATYDFTMDAVQVNLFLRGTNLLDEEARNAVSFLKDRTQLPGRGVIGGVKIAF